MRTVFISIIKKIKQQHGRETGSQSLRVFEQRLSFSSYLFLAGRKQFLIRRLANVPIPKSSKELGAGEDAEERTVKVVSSP